MVRRGTTVSYRGDDLPTCGVGRILMPGSAPGTVIVRFTVRAFGQRRTGFVEVPTGNLRRARGITVRDGKIAAVNG